MDGLKARQAKQRYSRYGGYTCDTRAKRRQGNMEHREVIHRIHGRQPYRRRAHLLLPVRDIL